jgi:hypothetical protein
VHALETLAWLWGKGYGNNAFDPVWDVSRAI